MKIVEYINILSEFLSYSDPLAKLFHMSEYISMKALQLFPICRPRSGKF